MLPLDAAWHVLSLSKKADVDLRCNSDSWRLLFNWFSFCFILFLFLATCAGLS